LKKYRKKGKGERYIGFFEFDAFGGKHPKVGGKHPNFGGFSPKKVWGNVVILWGLVITKSSTPSKTCSFILLFKIQSRRHVYY